MRDNCAPNSAGSGDPRENCDTPRMLSPEPVPESSKSQNRLETFLEHEYPRPPSVTSGSRVRINDVNANSKQGQ